MNQIKLTYDQVYELADKLAEEVPLSCVKAYAIPRGGVPAALAVRGRMSWLRLVDDPANADLFIDDIVDSGATMEYWCDRYPGTPFCALIDRSRKDCPYPEGWIVFPWERTGPSSIQDNIRRLLQFIGEDPERDGLLETPNRVAKAWADWCSGYGEDSADVLKTFEDGAESYDAMVLVRDVPFYSHCEHHLAPFFGTATIAYIPDGQIVGLSKLARLLHIYARRLQVQERLTTQIADAIDTHLRNKGVGVIIKARHLCMESRGASLQGHHTITSALRGAMRDQPDTRAEFMALAK